MYTYWGFGLHIASEIEFPELLPSVFDQADVTISFREELPEMQGIVYDRKYNCFTVNATEMLFEIKGVTTFYIANGNEIIARQRADVPSVDIRLYILASAVAALLLQRQTLPLHASAINKNGKLTLIAGKSGAGKSTSVTGLSQKGHIIFSDDVVVLENADDGHSIVAAASYPMIKLWEDTASALDHERYKDRSYRIRSDMNKFGIFFHGMFDKNSYPVEQILILKKGDVTGIESRELKGVKALDEVTRQVYRPFLLHNDMLKKLCFSFIAAMLRNCRVYEIIRPAENDPELLVSFIEKSFLA